MYNETTDADRKIRGLENQIDRLERDVRLYQTALNMLVSEMSELLSEDWKDVDIMSVKEKFSKCIYLAMRETF